MKKCKTCGVKFPKAATGPWCHSCVTLILWFLGMKSETMKLLVRTAEKLKTQLRKAKAEGKSVKTTDVPGPYWGLEL